MLVETLLVVAALGAPGQSQAPAPPPNPSLIRVFVATESEGEPRELADRRTSVADLTAALSSKKKSVVIVDDEDKADVVIEVIQRAIEVPKVMVGIGSRPGEPPGGLAPARTGRLRVTLMFGAMAVNLENKNKTSDNPRGWKSAADDVADRVDKWIDQFRAEIIKAR